MNNIPGPHRPSFGQSKPAARQVADFNLDDLRGGEHPVPAALPRWTWLILAATLLGLLGGGWYFIQALLAFKQGISNNATAVLGPYPSSAVVLVIIPAFCGPFYFLLDYLGLKLGLSPFTSPAGIAGSILLGIILLTLSFLPVSLIRHADNRFALAHGYIRCSSPFDPTHQRVYALRSFADVYGCPTVMPPQN